MRKFLKYVGCFFGWFNILPVNILAWLFFFLPQYLRGTFQRVQFWPDGMITWDVDNNSKFYKKLTEDNWWGFVIGSNVVFVDYKPQTDDGQHLKHEEMHVYQNYMFGVLFYPAYVAIACYFYLFKHNLHPYHDNPFEVSARKYAKQKEKIPIEEWKDGTNDRWPWW